MFISYREEYTLIIYYFEHKHPMKKRGFVSAWYCMIIRLFVCSLFFRVLIKNRATWCFSYLRQQECNPLWRQYKLFLFAILFFFFSPSVISFRNRPIWLTFSVCFDYHTGGHVLVSTIVFLVAESEITFVMKICSHISKNTVRLIFVSYYHVVVIHICFFLRIKCIQTFSRYV